MLGSIFLGKWIYQDGKYRTEGMNSAFSLILHKTSELQKKTGNIVISENVSGDVPKAGVEPTTCALRMREKFILTGSNIFIGSS